MSEDRARREGEGRAVTIVPVAEMAQADPTPPDALSEAEVGRVRERVRLLVRISSRIGAYRSGLDQAAERLTPPEAAIVADLERHGLDVPQLRDVLYGAHVLIDDPDLYAAWRFPKSIDRLSSHHKNIDKKHFPDIGLKGPLVREHLHGRTQAGTWMQLEKTPAAMGDGFRLPTFTDLKHLVDYFIYRLTKSNVGPWGLSRNTERRPMYLSPSLSSTVDLPRSAEGELTATLSRIERDNDPTSASPDLAARFPAPDRPDTLVELQFLPLSRNGRGLFGASDVYVTEAPSPIERSQLEAGRGAAPMWSLEPAVGAKSVTAHVGDREIRYAVRSAGPSRTNAAATPVGDPSAPAEAR